MRLAVRILGGLLLGLFAGAPWPASAATISGISIVKNAGNTADFFDDVGAEASVATSTVSTSAITPDSFTARYAAVVGADRGGSGGSGTTTQNFTGNFSITFSVTALATNSWYLTLDVLRIGAQTIISDGTGNANIAMGALTGTETGAGSITSGSMSLAALTTLSNAGSQNTSPNTAFNQAGQAVITGTGTGAAQTVILNFVFNATTNSVDPSGGSIQGDEAALRMGIDSALSQFTADDYPGAGLRNLNTDGIWVLFQLDESPEPGTALLLGLGLFGLGIHRRAHRG
jgi:PEP-CTERM motif